MSQQKSKSGGKNQARKRRKKKQRDKEQAERRNRNGKKPKGLPFDLAGRRFYVRPLNEDDIKELESLTIKRRTSPLEVVKNQLADLDPETRRMAMREAIDLASKTDHYVNNEELGLFCDSREGAAYVLYFMIRKNHPDCSLQWCIDHCGSMTDKTFDAFMKKRDELMDGEKGEDALVEKTQTE